MTSQMFDMIEGRFNYDYRHAYNPCTHGLCVEWEPVCFVFPMNQVKQWVHKAIEEVEYGRVKRLLLVIPGRYLKTGARLKWTYNYKWETLNVSLLGDKTELHAIELIS